MCGIIGISSQESVYHDLFIGLSMLQHRGQDAFGIVTNKSINKDVGLIKKSITHRGKVGTIGIGHVRYPTNGSKNDVDLIQPLVEKNGDKIFAFNGNITNVPKEFDSDTKWLFHLLTRTDDVEFNIKCIYILCQGSFSCIFIKKNILYAFRDGRGIRPLCFGQYKNNFAFASESVVITTIGYKYMRDVYPGECISIHGRFLQSFQIQDSNMYTPCLFEYIYLARPDSIMDGLSVYKTRQIMGQLLAQQIHDKYDMIIPVPDTSRIAVIEMSNILNIPYVEALVKNRYVSRTFIQPTQVERTNSVTMKFSVVNELVRNKNILIVDDSIVRGTTMKRIIKLFKMANVKSISIASCAPPVVNINIYGIDIPRRDELVVNKCNDVCKYFDCSQIYWQDLLKLKHALLQECKNLTDFEDSVFKI